MCEGWGCCEHFRVSLLTVQTMNQVSSRGCSRAYILCVLFRALSHVRRRRSVGQPVSFPFSTSDVDKWLVDAQNDCMDQEFQDVFGGTSFSISDPSTYWTSPTHFFTW